MYNSTQILVNIDNKVMSSTLMSGVSGIILCKLARAECTMEEEVFSLM